ncbi:MAG: hypothetical protein ACOZQL_28895 [Myxococcota bacterium]
MSDEQYAQVQELGLALVSAADAFRTYGAPDDLEEFFAFYEDDEAAQQRIIKSGRATVASFRRVYDALAGVPEREKWLRPHLTPFRNLLLTLSAADSSFDAAPFVALAEALAAPAPAAGVKRAPAPGAASAEAKKALAFLARTTADRALLELIASKATAAEDKAGTLTLSFGRTRVELAPPRKPARGIPASYGELAAVHGSIRWKGEGSFGFTGLDAKGRFAEGTWEPEALEEGDNDALFAALKKARKKASDVHCAFSCGQNWILYDPTRTTKRDEPALAFVSHGDCKWVPLEKLDGLDARQVLLRLMAWQLADKGGLLDGVYA